MNKNFKLINFKEVIGHKNLKELYVSNGQITTDLTDQNDFDILDLKGCVISPGFIDPQVNGLNNCNFWDLKKEDFNEIDKLRLDLARSGVVAFCPTVITNSKEKIFNSIDLINKYIKESKNKPGAKILGIHVEGIFITKYGVHEEKHSIKDLTIKNIEPFIKENVILFTLAPELDKTGEAINYLHKKNILVSAGHTNASYSEGEIAFNTHGIKLVTHMFNAMKGIPGFNHRGSESTNFESLKEKLQNESKIDTENDGIIVSILKNKNVTCMAIPDNIHVSKEVISFLIKTKGINNFSTTTDLVEHGFFEKEKSKGMLGGGQISFDKCVSNLVGWNVSDLEDILISCSRPISKLLKNAENEGLGEISLNKEANLVIWDTEINRLKGTIMGQNLFLNY